MTFKQDSVHWKMRHQRTLNLVLVNVRIHFFTLLRKDFLFKWFSSAFALDIEFNSSVKFNTQRKSQNTRTKWNLFVPRKCARCFGEPNPRC